jgi:nucleoside-diphosphate-sugar epimerase
VILVAGGSGVVGSAIVRRLLADGREVRVMTAHPERSAARIEGIGATVVFGDVLRASTLPAAVDGAEVVIQALAFPGFPVEKPSKGYTFEEFEHHGTARLVAAAASAGVRRYVYSSGVGADPNGHESRFRAKWAGERAIQESGIPEHCILRPSWVYGPEDRALNRLVSIARRLPLVPVVGDGRQRLQPVFVDDTGEAFLLAARLGGPTGIFELGGPEVLTMNDVIHTLLDVMGLRRKLVHVPPWMPKAVGYVAQLLPTPPLSPAAVDFLTGEAVATTGALHTAFPELRLRPLREALTTYLAPRGKGAP